MARPRSTARSRSTTGDYQVFISHATPDKWIAKVLCEKLEGVGATTFRDDRDVDGGDDIPDEIRRQIKRSKELLVLLTPKSVGRPWVLLEIGAAWLWSGKTRITVVLYHVEVDSVPDMLKSKKAIALNDLDEYLSEVAKRVRALGR
ncbi:toll/interleukin-1 receptor domain-containing protein [Tautonia plasticadhaerens]|uniref:TIR domain protein n=1 Tax=Tautonia plasticadhaerens TaxID=2527974 RepID=A0A518HB65_9BACT|nr:toll/interleukin-1 receptor domain-containing protein [Tautonia plasticadhaerens]QDV38103.1 TIR domain protein [Tautonia plasticadhaerens]